VSIGAHPLLKKGRSNNPTLLAYVKGQSMDRRTWLTQLSVAGGAAIPWLATNGLTEAQQPAAVSAAAAKANGPLKITDVKTILTAPAGIRLVVVKVMTSEPGLYGLGCATFTQRPRVVATAVNEYLRPFLLNKDATQIEDTFQSTWLSSYWRNGPVLNNAISGVDMALWDILGKRAGLPLYQIFGGKCRRAVDTYRHASGTSLEAVTDSVRRFQEQGYRHIRVQVGVPGQATYGTRGTVAGRGSPDPVDPRERDNTRVETWDPKPYCRLVPRLFEHLRKHLGDEVELLHDMHERVPPILAMQLVKDLETYRPFFIEDPFSPEDIGYFEHLRKLTTTPIAMGELFNSRHEWMDLVSKRLIDFIRVHISQVGGLTMARKMAAMCELFAIRTAWHGPGDVSPVGHAANVHLDLAVPNFGIQEAREFTQAEQDVFPGCPMLKDGYYCLSEPGTSDKPGLGIDLDESLAAKFPIKDDPPFDYSWGNLRNTDGTVTKP
jgi:mannonate dehydratase